MTTEQIAELLEKHPRIVDLLRYCRHQLLDEKLITQDEFMSLLSTEGSVPRLESYDTVRAQIDQFTGGSRTAETTNQNRRRGIEMKATGTAKATEKDMTPVVLTADTLMALVERVVTLERQTAGLRELINGKHDALAGELSEAVDNIYKHCIPDIAPDGRLVFRAYNNIADPVQAFVQAEIIEPSAVERDKP